MVGRSWRARESMQESLDLPTPLTVPADARPGLPPGAWLVLAAAFMGWMFDGLEQGNRI